MPAVRAAVTEIRRAARADAIAGAEGAVKLLERLSPALANVDSSSGSLGAAVSEAIAVLAAIVVNAPLDRRSRAKALERLWRAREEDEMPYLERLDDYWGTYCGSPEAASAWADDHMMLIRDGVDGGYVAGSVAVLSALYAAARYPEILSLIERKHSASWIYREWGFKTLVALGRPAEALRYAEESRGLNEHGIHAACEELLLTRGMEEEAYRRYGRAAVSYRTTNLATFTAMRKKYPRIDPAQLLADLAAADPGREGRWFAAAVSAGFFDLALQLAQTSLADPKTLIRAAREYSNRDPAFTFAVAELALASIAQVYGFEITGLDVIAADRYGAEAARALGREAEFAERVRAVGARAPFIRDALRLK